MTFSFARMISNFFVFSCFPSTSIEEYILGIIMAKYFMVLCTAMKRGSGELGVIFSIAVI